MPHVQYISLFVWLFVLRLCMCSGFPQQTENLALRRVPVIFQQLHSNFRELIVPHQHRIMVLQVIVLCGIKVNAVKHMQNL